MAPPCRLILVDLSQHWNFFDWPILCGLSDLMFGPVEKDKEKSIKRYVPQEEIARTERKTKY